MKRMSSQESSTKNRGFALLHALAWYSCVASVGDKQGSLAGCSLWGHKESDTTEQLNCSNCISIKRIKKLSSMVPCQAIPDQLMSPYPLN